VRYALLAVAGLSPQVITETLFALHQQGKRIDEIHVITTRKGKELLYAQVLPTSDGKYARYMVEYGMDPPSIIFNHETIYTVLDEHGSEADDILTQEHNELLLKKCLDITYALTNREDTVVFFSIAGGRKTMSSCLMTAAQFYARPLDRIYHVMVSPEFENCREFFYPPKVSIPIELRDENGKIYYKESHHAQVHLVPVPFVSARNRILSPEGFPIDPETLMLSLIRDTVFGLTLDLDAATVEYQGKTMRMMPARLAVYAFFLMEKKRCRLAKITCSGCTQCYLGTSEVLQRRNEIAELYRSITGGRIPESTSRSGVLDLDVENFNSYKGRIRRDIEGAFGIYAAQDLALTAVGKRPDTRYGLGLDREKIKILNERSMFVQ